MIFFNTGPRRIMSNVGWHLIHRRHILDRELNLTREIFMQICYSKIATRRKNESRFFFSSAFYFSHFLQWSKTSWLHCLFSANGPAKHAENAAGSNNNPKNSWPLYLAFIKLSSVAYVLSQTNTTTMQSFVYVNYLSLIKWNDGAKCGRVCCLKFISLALWHSLVPRDMKTSFSWPIGLI